MYLSGVRRFGREIKRAKANRSDRAMRDFQEIGSSVLGGKACKGLVKNLEPAVFPR